MASKAQDKDFERRTKQSLERNHGCHVTKLRTIPPVIRTDEDGSTTEFAVEGTYDFLVLRRVVCQHYAHPYALECKTSELRRFDLATVSTGQMKGLVDFPYTAGVVFESSTAHRCFFIPKDELLRERTKKSMNLRELEEYAVELPLKRTSRQTLDYYDMLPLLCGAKPKAAQGEIFEENPT